MLQTPEIQYTLARQATWFISRLYQLIIKLTDSPLTSKWSGAITLSDHCPPHWEAATCPVKLIQWTMFLYKLEDLYLAQWWQTELLVHYEPKKLFFSILLFTKFNLCHTICSPILLISTCSNIYMLFSKRKQHFSFYERCFDVPMSYIFSWNIMFHGCTFAFPLHTWYNCMLFWRLS